jgi:hypothetical protein
MDSYTAKVLGEIQNAPGTWHSLRVGVFRMSEGNEEQIGEYTRNYTSLFRTFYPFTVANQAYALYSPYYTATRIMELPSCKDIGSEEPSSYGFCPVEYFVPAYVIREWTNWQDTIQHTRVNNPKPDALLPKVNTYYRTHAETGERYTVEKPSHIITPLTFYPFGFVAGCIWGDDNSWKIQYLDLSEAEKGILKREERFGYIELPNNVTLRDAIDMSDYLYDDEYTTISITIQQRFKLDTGTIVAPYE